MTMISKAAIQVRLKWRKRYSSYLDQGQAEEITKWVIEAMREPTDEMLAVDAPDMPAGGSVLEIYQAMIDEALK